jgi:exonuclease SbcC
MINGIRIINYESHKDTKLVFEPGLNVFVGESDKGKSGAFRAFDWARSNQPLGNGMLPLYWEGETCVEVRFDDGPVVKRIKGKQNQYQLWNPDLVFEGNAGTDVPKEIQTVFNMGDVNYQSQIDRAFLMFDTPGDRGRILNQIAGLDKIDSTLSAANSDILKLNREKNQLESTIEEKEKELIKFELVPKLQGLVEQAETLHRMINQTSSEITSVSKMFMAQSKIRLSLDGLEPKLDRAEQLKRKIEKQVVQASTVRKEVEDAEKWMERKAKIEKSLPDPFMIQDAEDRVVELKKVLDDMRKAEDLYYQAVKLKSVKEAKVIKLRELDEAIFQLEQSIPDVCPTCGTVLMGKK